MRFSVRHALLVRWVLAASVDTVIVLASFAHAEQPAPGLADFEDVAEKAGLTMMNVFGGIDTKKYIIETTGTGVAIIDFGNDGWPDIFLLNGTRLEGIPAGNVPTNPLYPNNRAGTFTDDTAKADLFGTGLGQGG